MVVVFRAAKYGDAIRLFFKQLFNPTSRVAANVYSYMFLCDFFNFFVILIGFNSFGVSTYGSNSRVPASVRLYCIF